MPKSNAEMVRESAARRRRRAREAGLCGVCCKKKPNIGRTICISCKAAKTARKKRKWQRDREAAKLRQLTGVQERAGDMASAYHLYADATEYYREALNEPTLVLTDSERIMEKVIQASFLGGNFKVANQWCERLLTMYRSDPQETAKSIETLCQMYRHLTLNCKGEAASTVIIRAVQIAEISGDARLTKLTRLRRADSLQRLGRFDEAAEVLREVGHIGEDDDIMLRCNYFVSHGLAAGAIGNAENAYEHFESALELAKSIFEPNRVATIWTFYGNVAQMLGDGARAKACYEQALFVASQYRITWMIAQLRLYYAWVLTWMGESVAAYPYLLDGLSSSDTVPFLDVFRACVGIPLALAVQDEATLARCAHPRAIELAFRLEMPFFIGGTASAFAQFFASRGRPRAARVLLHRALEKISDARFNLDLLIAVARYGVLSDIPRARALLEVPVTFPHAAVFEAGRALFEAFVEQRGGALARARTYALDAAARFDALQWHQYAELAHSVVPGIDEKARRKAVESTPFSHMHALTSREREVAALVLRGFTNREIASELTIALHTVEKHMNSIMNRLGVRSRYKVADLLEAAPP